VLTIKNAIWRAYKPRFGPTARPALTRRTRDSLSVSVKSVERRFGGLISPKSANYLLFYTSTFYLKEKRSFDRAYKLFPRGFFFSINDTDKI
jgi:hypothetical protein